MRKLLHHMQIFTHSVLNKREVKRKSVVTWENLSEGLAGKGLSGTA